MLTLIVGTNRPDSNTAKVAREVIAIYRDLGNELQIADLAELPLEIFSREAYAKKPASFQPFVDKILGADGLVLITPEYNGGYPGVLKYFIDMLPFPESFEARPVCFIGLAAGQWGALRPVEQLQAIFGYRNAHIFPARVFLPGIGGLLDEKGGFKDPAMRNRLKKQAEGFIEFVGRLKSGSS